nr:MAG TPA: hypothetical protein [Crassvirales sp.]
MLIIYFSTIIYNLMLITVQRKFKTIHTNHTTYYL